MALEISRVPWGRSKGMQGHGTFSGCIGAAIQLLKLCKEVAGIGGLQGGHAQRLEPVDLERRAIGSKLGVTE